MDKFLYQNLFPHLKEIKLYGDRTDEGWHAEDWHLKAPKLEKFWARHCNLKADRLSHMLQEMPSLIDLNLEGNSIDYFDGVFPLKTIRPLQSLSLKGNHIRGEDLKTIFNDESTFKDLKHLNLAGNLLNVETVRDLLHTLAKGNKPLKLESLDLTKCGGISGSFEFAKALIENKELLLDLKHLALDKKALEGKNGLHELKEAFPKTQITIED